MIGHKTVTEFEDQNGKVHANSGFIVTATGREYHYLTPHVDMICIEDIAHALSHLCRFNGHTNLYYSVAQHSMFVADKLSGTPMEKLSALLHDAAEAYVCDIPSPLKPLLGDAYRAISDACQTTINKKFGVPAAGEQIGLYDKAAALFEAEAFFEWPLEGRTLGDAGYDTSLIGLWDPWRPGSLLVRADEPPSETEVLFLEAFEGLTTQIKMWVGDD